MSNHPEGKNLYDLLWNNRIFYGLLLLFAFVEIIYPPFPLWAVVLLFILLTFVRFEVLWTSKAMYKAVLQSDIQKKNDKLSGQLNRYEKKISIFKERQQELASIKSENNKLKSELSTLPLDLETVTSHYNSDKRELNNLRVENFSLSNKIKSLQEEVVTTQKELKKKTKEVSKYNDTLSLTLGYGNITKKKIPIIIGKQEKKIINLNTKNSSLESQLHGYQFQLEQAHEQINDLNIQTGDMAKQFELLEVVCAEHKSGQNGPEGITDLSNISISVIGGANEIAMSDIKAVVNKHKADFRGHHNGIDDVTSQLKSLAHADIIVLLGSHMKHDIQIKLNTYISKYNRTFEDPTYEQSTTQGDPDCKAYFQTKRRIRVKAKTLYGGLSSLHNYLHGLDKNEIFQIRNERIQFSERVI
jgi:hypothetical protein